MGQGAPTEGEGLYVTLSPGRQVGHYTIESGLGGGGMAKVYKARHVLLESVHALKVLNPELVRDEELRQRFLSEGKIQARLRHPHIVPVTDLVAEPGIAGLVMDYIEGPTLQEYIDGLKAPPDDRAVRRLFLQILSGVGYAHQNGVIHRDIKPANILLERQPEGFRVRLLDFGIAKIVEGTAGGKETRQGARLGTPHYMSPEQVRGDREIDVRSDIFALGATLYELATGRLAFDGPSDFSIQEKIVRGHFEAPAALNRGLSSEVVYAIEKALSPDPAARFASCEAFALHLRRADREKGGRREVAWAGRPAEVELEARPVVEGALALDEDFTKPVRSGCSEYIYFFVALAGGYLVMRACMS